MSNLGQSIRSSVKWLSAGNVGHQIMQFAFGIVLAWLLVPADFGLLATTQIFTGLAGLIATSGMGVALIQAKHVEENDFHVVFTVQLLIGIVIYLGFFVISPYFAVWFGDPRYEALLRISTISFLLRPFANIPNCRLSRAMRFKEQALTNFAVMIATGLTSIALAAAGLGVWSLVLSGLLGSVLTMLILFRITCWIPKVRFDRQIVRRYANFGLFMTANDVICHFQTQIPNLLLSRMLGPSAVGLFNKADSLAQSPYMVISTSAYSVVFAALSKSQDNLDQARYLYQRMITLLVVYTLPMYLGLGWVAEPFIKTIYGSKWLPAAQALEILTLIGLYRCLIHPAGAVLAAMKRLDQEIVVQVTLLVVLAFSCFIAIPWGLSGVAWAVVLGQTYASVHMTWLACRCLSVSLSSLVATVFPGLLLNILMIAVLATFEFAIGKDMREQYPTQYLLSAASIGGLTYAVAFLFLPIQSLDSEVRRWKRTLRLARD